MPGSTVLSVGLPVGEHRLQPDLWDFCGIEDAQLRPASDVGATKAMPVAQRLGRTRSGPWVRAPRSASFNVGPALPDAIHGRRPGLGSTASRICPAMAMPSWPVAASAIT